MSPRIAKKDQGELPKPQVTVGTLGFLPLNAFSASCLQQGVGQVILDISWGKENQPFTKKSVKFSGKKANLDLKQKYFRSMSDVFYRGKLPQVLLVYPDQIDWPAFVQDVIQFTYKMISLGFFVKEEAASVQTLYPCFVLFGHGVYYDAFMQSLRHELTQLVDLDESIREEILKQFVRGVANVEGALNQPTEPYDLLPVPKQIKIAGATETTLQTVQSVLSLNSVVTIIENRVRRSAERLELETSLAKVASKILPNLALLENWDAKKVQTILEDVKTTVFGLAKKRQVVEDYETSDDFAVVPVVKKSSVNVKEVSPLTNQDAFVVKTLDYYVAQNQNNMKPSKVIGELTKTLESHLVSE